MSLDNFLCLVWLRCGAGARREKHQTTDPYYDPYMLFFHMVHRGFSMRLVQSKRGRAFSRSTAMLESSLIASEQLYSGRVPLGSPGGIRVAQRILDRFRLRALSLPHSGRCKSSLPGHAKTGAYHSPTAEKEVIRSGRKSFQPGFLSPQATRTSFVKIVRVEAQGRDCTTAPGMKPCHHNMSPSGRAFVYSSPMGRRSHSLSDRDELDR